MTSLPNAILDGHTRWKTDASKSVRHARMSRERPAYFVVVALCCLGWGSLAFGAVYPWGYWPLLIMCSTSGALGLIRSGGTACINRPLAFGCLLVGVTVLIQLLPLPQEMVAVLSPSNAALTRARDVGGQGPTIPNAQAQVEQAEAGRALSVDPPATWRAFISFAAFALFLLGTAHAMDPHESRWLVRGVMILGVVLALVGLIQQAGATTKLYGIWLPYYRGRPFGPFVNANHFAGWMLMAIPVSIGYFCGTVARHMAAVNTTWRGRLVWLSSRQASQLILIGAAILLMAISLVMTLSRSGIICLLVVLILVAILVRRTWPRRASSAVVVLFLTAVVVLSVGTAGTDTLMDRFGEANTLTLSGRTSIWTDTVRMIRQFPLTGTGLNTYATAMPFYQRGHSEFSILQAHNDYLQVAAEGGILVGSAVGILLLLFLREVVRGFRGTIVGSMDYWVRVGAITGLVSIGLQELADFSLQIPANATLFVLVCSLALCGWSPRQECVAHVRG